MKKLSLISLLLLSHSLFAAVAFPPACRGVSGIAEQWGFKGKTQQLYLVTNTSKHTIWLTHTKQDPGASAGWASQLAPNQWSALAMDRAGFAFDCTESKPGHEQRVTCQEVLAACQQNATFPKKLSGAFWVAENLPLDQLLSSVEQRGIILGEQKS